jgi:hypothetical protein
MKSSGPTQVVNTSDVFLLPILRGGVAGWCITDRPGGGCPILRINHAAIMAEDWLEQTLGRRNSPTRADGFALTQPSVAFVSIEGGPTVRTRREQGLPSDLRAVVVAVENFPTHKTKEPLLKVFPGRPTPEVEVANSLRFTPLDLKQRPIVSSIQRSTPAFIEEQGMSWSRVQHKYTGVCKISATPDNGLVATAGFVLANIKRYADLIGKPFVSCASNSYRFAGWPLVASVLLDANHPGSTPGALPVLQRLSGHPGVFTTLVAEGDAVARQVAGAWIVVARGEGLQQRVALLEHLRATIRVG